jgi:hypothetical protein
MRTHSRRGQEDLREDAPEAPRTRPADAVLALQGTAGNQATQRALAVARGVERATGVDLSGVRLHPDAAEAGEVGAHAYARGADVYFAPGRFDTGSRAGLELIGHELAHVAQQRQGRVAATSQAKGLPVNDDDGLEREADASGVAAAAEAIRAPAAPRAGALSRRSAGDGVIQMVKAYRVEYPTYKIVVSGDKIESFEGNAGDGMGINISFVMPDHSQHFAAERKGAQLKGLRIVEFEFKDDFWDGIQWKSKGAPKKEQVAEKWVKKMQNLPAPTWSDGASLTKFIKQTALGFKDAWLPVLKLGVKGGATVTYPGDDTGPLKPEDEVWAYDSQPDDGWVCELQDRGEYDYITIEHAERMGYKQY